MKASDLKERNPHINIHTVNVKRRALCEYLKSHGDTATDIFHGNNDIDGYDECFLDDSDCDSAFNAACAVLAYKLHNIDGDGGAKHNPCIFAELDHRAYASFDCFIVNELACEYGRQLHYIIAQKAMIPIENDE